MKTVNKIKVFADSVDFVREFKKDENVVIAGEVYIAGFPNVKLNKPGYAVEVAGGRIVGFFPRFSDALLTAGLYNKTLLKSDK